MADGGKPILDTTSLLILVFLWIRIVQFIDQLYEQN